MKSRSRSRLSKVTAQTGQMHRQMWSNTLSQTHLWVVKILISLCY